MGFLAVDKPLGVTSHDVVDAVRKALGGAKVGHCGTLDPEASGVLILCLGRATRLAQYVSSAGKEYETAILLDRRTDTGDLDGEVLEWVETPVEGSPSAQRVETALEGFRGEIMQRPHRVSAVKQDGKRLYELARQGAAVEDAAPRPIRIDRLEMLEYAYPRLRLRVACSSGTYIRQLGEDLGESLGTGGCVEKLVRTRVGPVQLEEALTPFQVAGLTITDSLEGAMVPPDRILEQFGSGKVQGEALERVRHGNSLKMDQLSAYRAALSGDLVMIKSEADQLVAIYRTRPGERLEPCKVLV